MPANCNTTRPSFFPTGNQKATTSAGSASASSPSKPRRGKKHPPLVLESFGKIGKQLRQHLTLATLRPKQMCQYDPCGSALRHKAELSDKSSGEFNDTKRQDAVCLYEVSTRGAGGSPCSTMSSEKRCFSFILAALRMVRIDRAVRPCFPITLPTSLCATRNRMTVESPSAIASTETLLWSSTRACAISVTRSVMFFTGFSPGGNCVASVITHTFRFWESRRNAQALSLRLVCGEIFRKVLIRAKPRSQLVRLLTRTFCFAVQSLNAAIPRSLRETVCRPTTRNLLRQLSLGTRIAFPKLVTDQ